MGSRKEAAGHSGGVGICLNHSSENWGPRQEQVS